MKNLSNNWFIEGLIDFEHKKYVLYSYLQEAKSQFSKTLLYPVFGDLIRHHENLVKFREEFGKLKGQFPKEISGVDMEKQKLIFRELVNGSPTMDELKEIVDFAIPNIRLQLDEGKEIYEFVDKQIEIETVGVTPIYRDEGYFLLKPGNLKVVQAYEYRFSVFERANEQFRGIHTRHIHTFDYSITTTFENIKTELIRNRKELPNPATYAVISGMAFPEQESLLPVVKRKLVRYLMVG